MTNTRRVFSLLTIAMLALFGVACDSESPTAPQQQPTPNPGQNDGSTSTWTVTVTPEDPNLDADGQTTQTTRITVRVRRTSDNGAPPNGTTAVLSTSMGLLINENSVTGDEVPVPLENGQGTAFLQVLGSGDDTIVLQARFEQSFGQGTIRLDEVLPPTEEEPIPLFIEGISPTEGHPNGGTTVTIFGTGFESPTRVFFGGSPANVQSASDSVIRVTAPSRDVPVGSIETVDVRVDVGVNTADAASDTLQRAFTYTRTPGGGTQVLRLISLTPTFGPNEGGTEITIFGEGFEDEVQVYFGTAARIEAPVLQVTDGRVVTLTPSATGPNAINQNAIVDVLVRNVRSGLEDTLAGAFQYGGGDSESMFISAISPGEGPYTGGTRLTIFGQGFEEPVAVEAGGVGQQIVSVTGTEIVVNTVPIEITSCADVSGPVSVTNIETAESVSGPEFTYRVFEPTIFSISPSSASESGGGTATISGSGFTAPVRVSFGATEVGGTVSADGSSVSVSIPPAPAALPTETCDDNGDGFSGTRELPLRVDVEVVNLVTDCSDSFSNGFTYNPASSACQNDVDPNPPEDDGGGGGGAGP